MKNTLCLWQCGRKTANGTGICDLCWKDRERIYLARKAMEAAAEKKPISPARRTALNHARAQRAEKLLKHLPATELFRTELWN
jgi:hypothetical protein